MKTNIETAVLEQIQKKAFTILKSRGHNQVIVYSPAANGNLDKRYEELLGFEKGNDFTAYWKDI